APPPPPVAGGTYRSSSSSLQALKPSVPVINASMRSCLKSLFFIRIPVTAENGSFPWQVAPGCDGGHETLPGRTLSRPQRRHIPHLGESAAGRVRIPDK